MDITSYLLGKKAGGGGGSNLQTKSVTVTENGSTTINPDEEYDGLSKVNLTTNVQPDLESKSITITTNTTTTITPSQDKDGLSSVEVTTNVAGGDPNKKAFQTETTTEMDNLSTMQEKDFCLIYNDNYQSITIPTPAISTTYYFPESVTLPSAITSEDSTATGTGMGDFSFTINPTSFIVKSRGLLSWSTKIEYTSTDGINYTKTSTASTITNANSITEDKSWLYYFMFFNKKIGFGGVYNYSNNDWQEINYDEDIKASNIKSGVTILGTTGNYEGLVENDVNFYDYDGTLLYSYTKEDFANLSALPANPTHTGLTSQGWNWALVNAKSYVSTYGCVNIGQIYTTSDGSTRLYISLPNKESLNPYLSLVISSGGKVNIDWGDGTTTELSSNGVNYADTNHAYSAVGDYVIKISPISNATYTIGGAYATYCKIIWSGGNVNESAYYRNCLKKVEIGSSCSIGDYAFYGCTSIETITMPSTLSTLGANSLSVTRKLKAVIMPNGMRTLGDNACNSTGAKVCVLNNGITTINQYALNGSFSKRICIPTTVTSIGAYALGYSYCEEIYMGNPTTKGNNICRESKVRKIATEGIPTNFAYNTPYLEEVTITSGATNMGDTAFYNSNLSIIEIPNTVINIDNNTFNGCYAMQNITLPANLTGIGGSCFYGCISLAEIKIPSGVSSIYDNCFNGCVNLKKVSFEDHESVPSLANVNAFTSTSSDLKIVVPDNLYSSWIATTGWSDSSIVDKIISVSDYEAL